MAADPPAGASEVRPAPSVIAIDGPSGAGKSTVSRGVARRLGWGYLDTGATYRALTLAAIREGLVPTGASTVPSAGALIARTPGLLAELTVSTTPLPASVALAGEDVSAAIRGPEVTATVSAVSAVPAVRRLLVGWQRRTALDLPGCVVEGRDIGAVVFPDALLKVWLTASASARARRRVGDPAAPGGSYADVRASLERRDRLDAGRLIDPALPAADAVELDSSGLDVQGVVARVLRLAASLGITAAYVDSAAPVRR